MYHPGHWTGTDRPHRCLANFHRQSAMRAEFIARLIDQLDKSVDVQQKYPRTDLYYPASQRVVSYPVFIATFVSFLPFEADEPLHVAMHVNRYIGARSSAIETQMRELFRKPDAGALSAAA
jgi:hypothetical protein